MIYKVRYCFVCSVRVCVCVWKGIHNRIILFVVKNHYFTHNRFCMMTTIWRDLQGVNDRFAYNGTIETNYFNSSISQNCILNCLVCVALNANLVKAMQMKTRRYTHSRNCIQKIIQYLNTILLLLLHPSDNS